MTDITDFTDRFAPSFARGLQEMGHIYDAEKISRQDMEYLSNVIKLDNLSEYTEPLTSLQGIEYFESLTELVCYYNQLTSLDVSANTALTVLDCSSNSLTSLDVSANTALTELWCGYNQLTSLDVSANTALTTLWCYYNQLESLDVSANTALTELECDDNQLTSLDVSANTALTFLECEDNPGDGVSTFPVTAWFDNDTKPDNLEIYQEQWTYGGKTITIEFQKAE